MTTAINTVTKGIVLIVDDAPGNLAVLSDMLSEADYRVLVATDGHSALEQIECLKPDIILLDIMMPGIDGFETCNRLKNNQSTAQIPIIFMTGLSELEDLLKGFGEGAVDYIVKPIKPAEVLARVDAQLSQARNSQRAEDTLNHIAFSALAFDRSGLITWLTATAVKVLNDCYPEKLIAGHEINNGDYLPKPIRDQISPLVIVSAATNLSIVNDIQVGSIFTGKIIPCHHANEYMLLIQKRTQEWDLDSLKTSFGLTAREAEILMWISRGKTNKEVGLILNTSPRTVNKHLEHVFEKLGVPTRTAAVVKVLQNGNSPGS